MKKTNKKGFTLIELLAVIIILGVLMIIAIPSVTQYISNSRNQHLLNLLLDISMILETWLTKLLKYNYSM